MVRDRPERHQEPRNGAEEDSPSSPRGGRVAPLWRSFYAGETTAARSIVLAEGVTAKQEAIIAGRSR